MVAGSALPMPSEMSQAQTSSALSSIDMILTLAGSASALNIAKVCADSSATADCDGWQHADSTVSGARVPGPGSGRRGHVRSLSSSGNDFDELRRNTSKIIEVLL